ncbi:hypothetical protein HRI_004661300 [Hibiscus trionum]|uniref:Uncharacterized protein n=1 Tax=Hibiscus trionum TaxID=183268 RepID=A0A9W7J758_HIBTR|nr:hypothetical protein HRI_004661300 [Hibiscus trionum]
MNQNSTQSDFSKQIIDWRKRSALQSIKNLFTKKMNVERLTKMVGAVCTGRKGSMRRDADCKEEGRTQDNFL